MEHRLTNVTIEIQTTTPAFGPRSEDAGFEIARILHSIQSLISAHGVGGLESCELSDWNGRRCGSVQVQRK